MRWRTVLILLVAGAPIGCGRVATQDMAAGRPASAEAELPGRYERPEHGAQVRQLRGCLLRLATGAGWQHEPWQRRENAGYWIDRRDMYAEALKEVL